MTDLVLTDCPGCGAPAEEVDRFDLPSTDGPLTHVLTLCVNKHRYHHIEEHP